MADTYDPHHPHEPGIPPALDDEGRCLVCLLMCQAEQAEKRAVDLVDARRRLADCTASRDRIEGVYELAQRDNVLLSAQLRELYAELAEALDRACATKSRLAAAIEQRDAALGLRQTAIAERDAANAQTVRMAGFGWSTEEAATAFRRLTRLGLTSATAYDRARAR